MIVIGEQFTSWARGKTVCDQIVIHESVTSSRAKTIAVLKARTLGVHFIVDRDGSVTQHAPIDRQCAHAGWRHNRRSIAVEIVNRYYGSQGDDGEPDIKAAWAHRGWYILPTSAQCEAAWRLIDDLIDRAPNVPPSFPGVTTKGFVWGRLPALQRVKVPRGIMAHHRTDHADGLFVEHYSWLRSEGEPPERAYTRTVEAASSGERLTSKDAA